MHTHQPLSATPAEAVNFVEPSGPIRHVNSTVSKHTYAFRDDAFQSTCKGLSSGSTETIGSDWLFVRNSLEAPEPQDWQLAMARQVAEPRPSIQPSHVTQHVTLPAVSHDLNAYGLIDAKRYTFESLGQPTVTVDPFGIYSSWALESVHANAPWLQTSTVVNDVDYIPDTFVSDQYFMPSSASTIATGDSITHSSRSIAPSEVPSLLDKTIINKALAFAPRKGRNKCPPNAHVTRTTAGPAHLMRAAAVMERSDGRFFCSELGCDASYRHAGDCRRHLKMYNGPFFPCQQPNCNMTFYRRDKLSAHLQQGHNIGAEEARAAAGTRGRQSRVATVV